MSGLGNLAEVLKAMKARASAEAALLTSGDGLVLDAVYDDGIDLESLAAYAASHLMVSERMGESAQFGHPESVIVIYQGRALVMTPIGPSVAVLVGPAAQLGYLRLQLRRSLDDLRAALEHEMNGNPAADTTQKPDDPEGVENPSDAPLFIESSMNAR